MLGHLASPCSVTTRHNPSKLGFCSRWCPSDTDRTMWPREAKLVWIIPSREGGRRSQGGKFTKLIYRTSHITNKGLRWKNCNSLTGAHAHGTCLFFIKIPEPLPEAVLKNAKTHKVGIRTAYKNHAGRNGIQSSQPPTIQSQVWDFPTEGSG